MRRSIANIAGDCKYHRLALRQVSPFPKNFFCEKLFGGPVFYARIFLQLANAKLVKANYIIKGLVETSADYI